jgi:hypothetical protein
MFVLLTWIIRAWRASQVWCRLLLLLLLLVVGAEVCLHNSHKCTCKGIV